MTIKIIKIISGNKKILLKNKEIECIRQTLDYLCAGTYRDSFNKKKLFLIMHVIGKLDIIEQIIKQKPEYLKNISFRFDFDKNIYVKLIAEAMEECVIAARYYKNEIEYSTDYSVVTNFSEEEAQKIIQKLKTI